MSELNSGVTAIQGLVLIIKNFHEEERALITEFNEKLTLCVNKIFENMMHLQGSSHEADKVKDTVQLLMMFLDSKAKMYSSTICSQIS